VVGLPIMMEQGSSPEKPYERPIPNWGADAPLSEPKPSGVGRIGGEITPPDTGDDSSEAADNLEQLGEAVVASQPEQAEEAAEPGASVLPDDITKVLDRGKRFSGITGIGMQVYEPRGTSDLLVHMDLEEGHSFGDFSEAITSARGVARYGVDVLPMRAKEYEGSNFVVTPKVIEGVPLDDVLRHDSDPEIVRQADQLLAKVGGWLLGETEANRPIAHGVWQTDRYRHGSVLWDKEKKLWLAHPPTHITSDENYALNVIDLANSVVDIENATDTRLSEARQAVIYAAGLIPKITEQSARATHAIVDILTANASADLDDFEDLI
jgi:hypothetical protein